jgi:hypothetical protein
MQRTLTSSAVRAILWQRTLYTLSAVAVTPGALVAAAAALQVAVWTITPAIINSAPPLDVVEGYMWGREWVLATYKHPAMPSWVLEMPTCQVHLLLHAGGLSAGSAMIYLFNSTLEKRPARLPRVIVRNTQGV